MESEVTGEPHSWMKWAFTKTTYCNVCTYRIWGIGKQGSRCSSCRFAVHDKCIAQAALSCRQTYVKAEDRESLTNEELEHRPFRHSFVTGNQKRMTTCCICRGSIGKQQDWKTCSWCENSAHVGGCMDKFIAQHEFCTPVCGRAVLGPLSFLEQTAGSVSAWDRSIDLDITPVAVATDEPEEQTEEVKEEPGPVGQQPEPEDHGDLSGGSGSGSGEGEGKGEAEPEPEEPQNQPAPAPAQNPPPESMESEEESFVMVEKSITPDKPLFEIKVVGDGRPIVAFINGRSGGQRGPALLRTLRRYLNKRQVFDVQHGGPQFGLEQFANAPNAVAFACGGDGTVGWLLATLDKLGISIPIAILPLGTGNDLARTFGWGPGYDGEKLQPILNRVVSAREVEMDRWNCAFRPLDPSSGVADEVEKEVVVNNYFSLGVDAAVAIGFHTLRQQRPDLFKSRAMNKMWYTRFGVMETFTGNRIKNAIALYIDGEEIELGSGLEGVIVVNLPSYAGGVDLWSVREPEEGTMSIAAAAGSEAGSDTQGQSKTRKVTWAPQLVNDRMIEVVGVNGSAHLGTIKTGVGKAIKLGQGRSVRIVYKVNNALPVQIDGEPWEQQPSEISISFLNQATMLVDSSFSSKAISTEHELVELGLQTVASALALTGARHSFSLPVQMEAVPAPVPEAKPAPVPEAKPAPETESEAKPEP